MTYPFQILNKMKVLKISIWFLPLLFLICMVSCTEEGFEFPDSEPLITGDMEINALPGANITIEASVTDPAGLKSVSLVYDEWSLSETFSVGESAVEYNVSHNLTVPETAVEGSSHDLKIVAENVNGISKEYTVTISLNQDTGMPVIENKTDVGIAFLQEGVDATLVIDVTDNQSIATFSITGANLSDKVDVNAASYTYTKELNIQVSGVYEFEVMAKDAEGNESSMTVKVAAFEPFEKMYLADVSTDAELVSDLMGVPMLVNGYDAQDSLGKVFEAHYYNAAAGTEIRFLPNKETFSELTLGSGDESGMLSIGSDASVAPIVLNEVGYNKISFDLRDLTYQVEAYTPTDSVYEYTIVMGTGVKVDGESTCINNEDGSDGACWWFGSGKKFTRDENNPYVFYGEMELYDYDPEQSGETGFILGANLSGWSDFWRFDQGENPDATVLNGGSNYNFGENEYGTYDVVFDTHLNRFKMTPKQ